MDLFTTLTLGPVAAVIVGAIAGLLAGKFLTGKALWILPGVLILASLYLIVRLAAVEDGAEEGAFALLAWLTGGVFPALFAVVMGTLGGRALSGRKTL
jgi:hypothetical protein